MEEEEEELGPRLTVEVGLAGNLNLNWKLVEEVEAALEQRRELQLQKPIEAIIFNGRWPHPHMKFLGNNFVSRTTTFL